ncbi:MAG: isoprenylcysteine carboxylmethyltransferase family protein [Acidobacteria bacterium]|nr:isoprenylcysteine carboxylmethyltransferase family protein [Acidobacteriota bacterium]
MPPRLQGPRIAVPPPFVFLAGWVAAWILAQRLPFAIDGGGASGVQEGLGVAIAAAGLALAGWAMGTFLSARTAIVPIKPARTLVTHGPFRFSRNPMYVGLTGAYVGLAVLLNQAWPLVVLPAVVAVLVVFVIRREERYLGSVFGLQYEAYCRRVRRWV